jgi:hypothetical protein
VDDLELISRFVPMEAPSRADRHRAETRLAEAITGSRTRDRRTPTRRRSRRFALGGALVAAAAAALALIMTLSPAGGGGVQSAQAAVEQAGAATAAAARHSGTVEVRMAHNGRPWSAETVHWNQGNASVVGSGVGSPGRLLFVDGVLFTKVAGSWAAVDKGGVSGYMRQRYIAPALNGIAGNTFRHIVGGIQDLQIRHGQDGTTVFSGRESARLLTSDPRTGERIRVLPFGFVAHGEAADPNALLRIAVTVGSDHLIQRIAVAWGAGASAWSYTVTYANLGNTLPISGPPTTS